MKFKVGKELKSEGIAYKKEKCPFCKGELLPKNQEIYYESTPINNGFINNYNYFNFWECLKCGKRFEILEESKKADVQLNNKGGNTNGKH